MAHEIELKLALGALAPQALGNISPLTDAAPRRLHLRNTYFDTRNGDLEAAGMALRLRHDGKSYCQTLKTRGHSQGGLSSRGEWEWQVPGPALDLDGLAALPPLAAFSRQQLSRLEPMFTTDFQREVWLLESPQAHIEVALDTGEIRAGQDEDTSGGVPIRELELELKRGEPEALLNLAQSFAEQIVVRPSDTSKAARGNILRGRPWQLPPPNAPLQRLFVALDALADTGDPTWQTQARQALMTLANSADDAISQPALALAEALEHWDRRCGQLALQLVRQLTPSAPRD